MAEVLLLHHAPGLTPGVRTIADGLRAAGHTVHTPDLYDGRTFAELSQGVAHAERTLGMDEVIARGVRAAEALPAEAAVPGPSWRASRDDHPRRAHRGADDQLE